MNQWHERRKQEEVQAAATAMAQMRHSGELQENESPICLSGLLLVPLLVEPLKLMALFVGGRYIGFQTMLFLAWFNFPPLSLLKFTPADVELPAI